MKLPTNKIFIIYALIIFISLASTISYLSLLNVDVLHQGLIFSASKRLIDNQAIYQPTLYHYGPLQVFINSFFILFFGKKLVIIQIVTALLYSIIGVLLFKLWAKFMPITLSFILVFLAFLSAPFFYFELHPWSSVWSLLFSLLLLDSIFKYIDSNNKKYLLYSGIVIGLIFWSRQTVGIMMFLFTVMFLIQYKKNLIKNLYYFNFGLVITMLAGLLVFFKNETYDMWIRVAFIDQLTWAKSIAELDENGINFFLQIQNFLKVIFVYPTFNSFWGILALTLVAYFFYIIFLSNLKKNAYYNYHFAFIFISLASWSQYFPVADPRHFFWSSIIFMASPINLMIQSNFFKQKKLSIFNFLILLLMVLLFVNYFKEIKYRFYSGIQLDKTIKLDNVFDRISKYRYSFQKPYILKHMKGSKTQVNSMEELINQLEKFDFENGASFECRSGWDRLCPYYVYRIKKNSNGLRKKIILSDYPLDEVNYDLFYTYYIDEPLAYMASNPAKYFIYVEK